MTVLTFIPGQLLITFFTALFYAKEASVLPNMLLVAVNLALILLIPSAGIVHAGLDAKVYLRIYFWGVLLQGLLLAVVFAWKYGRTFRLPDSRLLKKIFRYSIVALAANALFFLVYRVDYWFVKRFCTADQLGNYIQVSKLGQIVLLLPGILASVIFPRTALGKQEDMARALTRMTRIAALLFCLVFLIVFFTGRTLFPLVFGSSLQQMYVPMLILLPGVLFLSVLSLLSAYFGGIHRPDINAKGALAGLIVIIIGDILVIPRYNIAGAAAVSSAGYLVCLLYSWIEFKKIKIPADANG
jgi:O-antigen/teichoic acid export membrane protein